MTITIEQVGDYMPAWGGPRGGIPPAGRGRTNTN